MTVPVQSHRTRIGDYIWQTSSSCGTATSFLLVVSLVDGTPPIPNRSALVVAANAKPRPPPNVNAENVAAASKVSNNGLDTVVHGPVRLGVITALQVDGPLDFTTLVKRFEVAEGAMGVHQPHAARRIGA